MAKTEPSFHTRLRMLRTERGLSRRKLAEHTGVHYQTIEYIERAEYNPSLEVALKIAKVLDLPVDVIFSLEPFPTLDAAALMGSG